MTIYRCDRCGKFLDCADWNPCPSIDPDKVVYNVLLGVKSYDLCEQCYTTIKEVLEDGGIK